MTIEMTHTSANKLMARSCIVVANRFVLFLVAALVSSAPCFDSNGCAQEARPVAAGGGQREFVQSTEYRPARHAVSSSVNGANYIASNGTQYTVPQSGSKPQESGFLSRVEERQSHATNSTLGQSGNQSASDQDGKTPLPPPKQAVSDTSTRGGTGGFLSMLFSLVVVVGLFLGCVWVYRKFMGNFASAGSTTDPLKILARKTVGPRHQLAVIEFGPKLLLVSMQQGDARTLSEIDEPSEVSRWKEQVVPDQKSNPGRLASWGVAAGQNNAIATRSGLAESEPQAALARAGLNSAADKSASKKSFRAMLQDGVAAR
ncbi:MAG: FliO/MopB family protein [Pirellulaceae bacterium]